MPQGAGAGRASLRWPFAAFQRVKALDHFAPDARPAGALSIKPVYLDCGVPVAGFVTAPHTTINGDGEKLSMYP